ncbi:MAG: 4Fe-4S binding protein [Spirochaetia bacterium]|nr:4Fe-4S binding protein [Spirochaetia bacterium]
MELADIRTFIQVCAAALANGYIKGFARGRIYDGPLKQLCVPGLNCYSCPAALGACPIGSLQGMLGSHSYKAVIYVLGFLVVFGTLMGRFVCGFLCPFGLVQDLLFKVPLFRKIQKLPGEKGLRWLRFVILGLFVILLPLFVVDITGLGEAWFCKYICPAGTLEGGIPLVLMNNGLRSAVGFLYRWKLALLAITLAASLVIYRPFCRYICPLGAIYGVFNKVAIYRLSIDTQRCIRCGKCAETCKLSINVFENPNSMDCIRCGECASVCPQNAIKRVAFLKK